MRCLSTYFFLSFLSYNLHIRFSVIARKDAIYAILPPLFSFNCLSGNYYALRTYMCLFLYTYVAFSCKLSIVTRKRYYLWKHQNLKKPQFFVHCKWTCLYICNHIIIIISEMIFCLMKYYVFSIYKLGNLM